MFWIRGEGSCRTVGLRLRLGFRESGTEMVVLRGLQVFGKRVCSRRRVQLIVTGEDTVRHLGPGLR